MRMEREGNSRGASSGDETSLWSKAKKRCACFFTSLQEGLQHIKATVIGQVKKAKATDEKEASKAELEAEKMQVEAANEAENKKNQLGM